jgi:hypothetical protein
MNGAASFTRVLGSDDITKSRPNWAWHVASDDPG